MKYALLIIATSLILASCSNGNAVPPSPVPPPFEEVRYLQLSSLVDQVADDEGFIAGRILTETVDGQQGVGLGDLNAVVIEDDGVYLVVLAPQSGKASGCGRYWINVNGAQVPNSNIMICQSCPTLTTVGVSQGAMPLVEGDIVTFHQSGKLGIQATFPDDVEEPTVPSVIITVVKL